MKIIHVVKDVSESIQLWREIWVRTQKNIDWMPVISIDEALQIDCYDAILVIVEQPTRKRLETILSSHCFQPQSLLAVSESPVWDDLGIVVCPKSSLADYVSERVTKGS